MKKKIIWANCLVRNEERWVWYAIMSVIDYVDKILVWDTGSTDKTVEIIKSVKNPKIEFREYGGVTKETYPQVRQAMLEATKADPSRPGRSGADWVFILDGDEVWTNEGISKVVKTIQDKGDEIESIVVKTINLVGDVYHRMEDEAGQYEIAGRKGHLSLRVINMKIPGLHASRPHGQMGYFDANDQPVQERDHKKIVFLPVSYFHTTHLARSSAIDKEGEVPLRLQKRKYEIGTPLDKKIQYPEVFYKKRPDVIPSPWVKMSSFDFIKALVCTPFKKLKRRLVKYSHG